MQKINDLSEKQDKELVELLMEGSHDAFGELYARYKERLMVLCKRYLKNETDSEDIVQDIFVQLWETRHLLNPELSFSGYVQQITRNYAKDKLRHLDVHSRFARNILLNVTDLSNETEDEIADKDYAKLLNELVESLPERQKEIFRLSRIERLKYHEISKLLQISIPAVQKHASLALKRITEQLQQHANIHFKIVKTLLLLIAN